MVTPELAIIVKDGTINSFLTSLVVAIFAKKDDVDVAVVFIQEAVAAIADKRFEASQLLKPYIDKIYERFRYRGATNPIELIKIAKEAGVAIYACNIWVEVTNAKDKLPPEITIIEPLTVVKYIIESKRVITF